MRKVIQVTSSQVENTQATQCNMIIIALCDDGTLWQTDEYGQMWHKMLEIPQDDPENEPVWVRFKRDRERFKKEIEDKEIQSLVDDADQTI